MPLSDLRAKIARMFAGKPPHTIPAPTRANPHVAGDRARVVAELRADVSRLQAEIAELSRPTPEEVATGRASVDVVRVTHLQSALDAAQAELAKYQARI